MGKKIDRAAVLRLMENNGFDLEVVNGSNNLLYEDNSDGFRLLFAAPWLMNDDTTMYDLASAHGLITNMLNNVKYEHSVYAKLNDHKFLKDAVDTMTAFGMSYDENEDVYFYNATVEETDASGKTVQNRRTLFYFAMEDLAALAVQNPTQKIKVFLEGMLIDTSKGLKIVG